MQCTETLPIAEGPTPMPTWRRLLAEAVRDPAELCRLLELPAEFAPQVAVRPSFPLLAPRGFLGRMRRGDPADPLLRQVLPLAVESQPAPGFSADPVGEIGVGPHTGLLRKYAGRALLVLTGACAVHCRYCFRREFPYEDTPKSLAQWEPALAELARDESIHEVLLSGGDPLTRVDPWLAALAERLAAIPHLRRLRVHSRLPIVLPERVDDALLGWLTGTRLAPVMVVHCNHPAELDVPTRSALRRLVQAGVPTLNQAVLLAGVNDHADILAELCETLVDLGVLPYYLHQLDRVSGAAHFEVPEARGAQLIAELTTRLPGYAVPRYVREIPGAPGKTPMKW